MSRRKILLVQLPIPPLGPQPIRGNVPLAAGYLKLFARQQGLEESFSIEILPAELANRLGDRALVEHILGEHPWMVGFTCYLWNIDRTLWIARQLKRQHPELLVLIGGPEIAPGNGWVLEHPAYDYAAVGEGEQTFAELLGVLSGRAGTRDGIAGLAYRDGSVRANPPRRPMPALDPISSPYLAGILNAGDQEQLLLETVRGCVFRCKFCYYPKAYDGLYYVSRDKILANLAHARDNGAREVYLLDPTLNQRRDFADFLALLREGNPDGTLEFYGELRGEGITAAHAAIMRQANFREVEIGLQSIDPLAQELMERRNNLKGFERGVRALRDEGIRVKVDLIVGLPGDTTDSVRRGMHYLAENELYDDIQVFQLSILPGTAFRHEAAGLGLQYQPRPPYYVLRTPTLALDDMLGLLDESAEIFETEFDPLPAPSLDLGPGASSAGCRIDLDDSEPPSLPDRADQAFTLWFRSRDLYARLPQAAAIVRRFLAANPFATLQIVLEAPREFPFDVFAGLRAAWDVSENIYLDRFYEFTPGRAAGARRIVTLFPSRARHRLDPSWVCAALEHTDIVWNTDAAAAADPLRPMSRAGEWCSEPDALHV